MLFYGDVGTWLRRRGSSFIPYLLPIFPHSLFLFVAFFFFPQTKKTMQVLEVSLDFSYMISTQLYFSRHDFYEPDMTLFSCNIVITFHLPINSLNFLIVFVNCLIYLLLLNKFLLICLLLCHQHFLELYLLNLHQNHYLLHTL